MKTVNVSKCIEIGSGAFGCVFKLPDSDMCVKVAKNLYEYEPDMMDEFRALEKAYAIAPDLFPKPGELVLVVDENGIVADGYTMEYVDLPQLEDCYSDYTSEKRILKTLIYNDLAELGIEHCDLHTENILYNKATGDFKVIDAGGLVA